MTTLADLEATTLRAYAAGERGTRATIETLGLRDYADLLIALARHELPLPQPPVSAARDMAISRARAILQPRLRHDP